MLLLFLNMKFYDISEYIPLIETKEKIYNVLSELFFLMTERRRSSVVRVHKNGVRYYI